MSWFSRPINPTRPDGQKQTSGGVHTIVEPAVGKREASFVAHVELRGCAASEATSGE